MSAYQKIYDDRGMFDWYIVNMNTQHTKKNILSTRHLTLATLWATAPLEALYELSQNIYKRAFL